MRLKIITQLVELLKGNKQVSKKRWKEQATFVGTFYYLVCFEL